MLKSSTIMIDGIGPVLFEVSRRARRLNISVRPQKGVRVAVPYGLTFVRAEELVKTKLGWIRKQLSRIREAEKRISSHSGSNAHIDREEARRYLTERLRELARTHGFSYNRVFIRSQKTRWGSCSSKNNINLNMKLLTLPEDLIDYVLIHELVHTRIRNHGKGFWAEMDRIVGNGRAFRKRLKNYRIV